MISKKKILVILFSLIIFSGCINTKRFIYFNDLEKANRTDTITNTNALKIERGDILQITISTIDKDVSQILNPTGTTAPGYLVDTTGSIEIPLIGTVNVAGKTITELNYVIKTAANATIKNVFVATRLLNFRISVLGDVARPGTYNISNERISILEALSLAGDVNFGARRDDIMLIREAEGKRQYISIDLNNSKIFSSSNYYLKNKDVVYVKPRVNKLYSSTGFQILPTIFGALSLALGIYVTLRR